MSRKLDNNPSAAYEQLRQKFVNGIFLCSEQEATYVAALQCRVDWGPYVPDLHAAHMISAKDCLPATHVRLGRQGFDARLIIGRILKLYAGLPDKIDDPRQLYVEALKNLSAYSSDMFGLESFENKEVASEMEKGNPLSTTDAKKMKLRVGVGYNGVVMIDEDEVVVKAWRYADIESLKQDSSTSLVLTPVAGGFCYLRLFDARIFLESFAALVQGFEVYTRPSSSRGEVVTTVARRPVRKSSVGNTVIKRSVLPSPPLPAVPPPQHLRSFMTSVISSTGSIESCLHHSNVTSSMYANSGRPDLSIPGLLGEDVASEVNTSDLHSTTSNGSAPLPAVSSDPYRSADYVENSSNTSRFISFSETTPPEPPPAPMATLMTTTKSLETRVAEYDPVGLLVRDVLQNNGVVRSVKYRISDFSASKTRIQSSQFVTIHSPTHFTVLETVDTRFKRDRKEDSKGPKSSKKNVAHDQVLMNPNRNLLAARDKSRLQLIDLSRNRRVRCADLMDTSPSNPDVFWKWLWDGRTVAHTVGIATATNVWHWDALGDQQGHLQKQFQLMDSLASPNMRANSYHVDDPKKPSWAVVAASDVNQRASGKIQLYNYEKLASRELDGYAVCFIRMKMENFSSGYSQYGASDICTVLALVHSNKGRTQLTITPCGPSIYRPRTLDLEIDASDHVLSLIPIHSLNILWLITSQGWVHVVDAHDCSLILRTHKLVSTGVADTCEEADHGGCILLDYEGRVITLGVRRSLLSQSVDAERRWGDFAMGGGLESTANGDFVLSEASEMLQSASLPASVTTALKCESISIERSEERKQDGSYILAAHPALPLDAATLLVPPPPIASRYRTDSISRGTSNRLTIIGALESPGLQGMLDALKKQTIKPLSSVAAVAQPLALDEIKSSEHVQKLLAEGREEEVARGISSGLVLLSEPLTDVIGAWLVYHPVADSEDPGRLDLLNLILAFYAEHASHTKSISLLTWLGRFDGMMKYLQTTEHHPLITDSEFYNETLSTISDGLDKSSSLARQMPYPLLTTTQIWAKVCGFSSDLAAQFSGCVNGVETGDIRVIDHITDLFVQQGLVKPLTDFLSSALKNDRKEEAELQTRLLKLNINFRPEVADALLRSRKFSHFDKAQVAELCMRCGLPERTLDIYIELQDWKSISSVISPKAIGNLPDVEVLRLLEQLIADDGIDGAGARSVISSMLNGEERTRLLVLTSMSKHADDGGERLPISASAIYNCLTMSGTPQARSTAVDFLEACVIRHHNETPESDLVDLWMMALDLYPETNSNLRRSKDAALDRALQYTEPYVTALNASTPGSLVTGYIALSIARQKYTDAINVCVNHPNIDLLAVERKLYALLRKADSRFGAGIGDETMMEERRIDLGAEDHDDGDEDDIELRATLIGCLRAISVRDDTGVAAPAVGARFVRHLLADADLRSAGDFFCLLRNPAQVIPIFEELFNDDLPTRSHGQEVEKNEQDDDDAVFYHAGGDLPRATEPQLRYLIAAMDARGPIKEQLKALVKDKSQNRQSRSLT